MALLDLTDFVRTAILSISKSLSLKRHDVMTEVIMWPSVCGPQLQVIAVNVLNWN